MTQNTRKESSYPSSCPQVGSHLLPADHLLCRISFQTPDCLAEKSEEFTRTICSEGLNPTCLLQTQPYPIPASPTPSCFLALVAVSGSSSCFSGLFAAIPPFLEAVQWSGHAGPRWLGLNPALLYSNCVATGKSLKPQVLRFFIHKMTMKMTVTTSEGC